MYTGTHGRVSKKFFETFLLTLPSPSNLLPSGKEAYFF
jgi:hypothetical protein